MEYIPYTYYLYHIPTGKKYYGSEYKKTAHPSNLWNKYFSSSKQVKKLIQEYGANSFIAEIRKTFKTRAETLYWENRVLHKLKAVEKKEWLNQAYACGPYYAQQANITSFKPGQISWSKGKQLGPQKLETIQKRIKSNTGKTRTQKTKDTMSESQKAAWKTRYCPPQPIVSCVYCGKLGSGPVMRRYHFENCRKAPNTNIRKPPDFRTRHCPHCGTSGRGGAVSRHHFSACKQWKPILE